MSQVRLIVSLSSSDVAALDRYVRTAGLKTRSAAIQRAIRLLGDREAEHDYGLFDGGDATPTPSPSGNASPWTPSSIDGRWRRR